MLRSIAKDTAARVASWSGIDAVARKSVRRDVPYVVGYHRVVEETDRHKDIALPAMEIFPGAVLWGISLMVLNVSVPPASVKMRFVSTCNV